MRFFHTLALVLLTASTAFVAPQDGTTGATPDSLLLEIRSYNLRPGERDRFHDRFVRESLPLLHKWNVDVVAYGPSAHDRDSYFLMRAFSSLEARTRDEDAFYASKEWRDGPREAVLAAIENYTTIIVAVDRATANGLRRTMPTTTHANASDLETLTRLNDDYIQAVQHSNVARFREILADDFLATMADGTLLDRAQFLENTAKPSTVANLAAHDVNIRLLDDVAIIHARTTYTLPGGGIGNGRYTDIWAKRNGRWLAVAAHVTRK